MKCPRGRYNKDILFVCYIFSWINIFFKVSANNITGKLHFESPLVAAFVIVMCSLDLPPHDITKVHFPDGNGNRKGTLSLARGNDTSAITGSKTKDNIKA